MFISLPQESMSEVSDQYWVVDANVTAVVTPRVSMSLRCACSAENVVSGQPLPLLCNSEELHPENEAADLDAEYNERPGMRTWPLKDRAKEEKEGSEYSKDLKHPDNLDGRSSITQDPESQSRSKVDENVHYRNTFESLTDHRPGLYAARRKCRKGLCLNGGRCIESIYAEPK